MKQQWFELSALASSERNWCSPVSHSPHPSLLCQWKKVKFLSRVRLCNPMDCSLPGSSIHGIFQARILEWVNISFSRRSSRPRDWPRVSHIVGRQTLYRLSDQGSYCALLIYYCQIFVGTWVYNHIFICFANCDIGWALNVSLGFSNCRSYMGFYIFIQ